MTTQMELLNPLIKGHDTIQDRLFKSLEDSRLPHALLFAGPEGVGKKQMAWALAQTLLCETSRPACGECSGCRQVQNRSSQSVFLLSPKGLRIRIDDAKEVAGFLSLRSQTPARIVIIDEAHLLNLQAANSLLKIIEEPPKGSYFFLISSLPSQLPLTLSSRLQKIPFQALPERVLKELSSAPDWMIKASQGRMDRILELQSQSPLRDFAFSLWRQIQRHKNPLSFSFPLEIKDRKTALFVTRCWQQLLRDSRFLQTKEEAAFIHEDQKDLIKSISAFPKRHLDFLIEKALELEKNINSYRDTLLCFEHFAFALKECSNPA